MDKQLYLVTCGGERHEDHIPVGVYDFQGLLNEFGAIRINDHNYDWLTEDSQIEHNNWFEIRCLDFEEYSFSTEEIELWKNGDSNLECDKYYHSDPCRYFNVIKITVNSNFPGT